MARPEKVAAVAEIREDFANSEAIILTEYRGLTVKQMARLRRNLAKDGARYKVLKMTLARRAAQDAGLDGLLELLVGPTAIVFCEADPVGPAKSLEAFRREAEVLLVKGGVLGGGMLSAEQVVELSRLDSREVLLAKLAGAFQAPLARMAGLLAAMPTQMAGLVKALADTKPPAPVEDDVETPTAPAAAVAAGSATDAPATASPQSQADLSQEQPADADAASTDADTAPGPEDAPAGDVDADTAGADGPADESPPAPDAEPSTADEPAADTTSDQGEA